MQKFKKESGHRLGRPEYDVLSSTIHDTKNFVCASVVGLIFLGYIVRKSEKIFRKTTVCAVKLSLPKEVSREIV